MGFLSPAELSHAILTPYCGSGRLPIGFPMARLPGQRLKLSLSMKKHRYRLKAAEKASGLQERLGKFRNCAILGGTTPKRSEQEKGPAAHDAA